MSPERLYRVLVGPYTTEKTVKAAEAHQCKHIAFKVVKDATKTEVKKAVETLFKVAVKSIKVCNVKGKVKNFRQTQSKRRGFRKATVVLEEGQDINWSEFE